MSIQLPERVPGCVETYRRAISLLKSPALPVVELTVDDVRNAGGIVHKDGNIFFTNIDKLNAAIQCADIESPAYIKERDEYLSTVRHVGFQYKNLPDGVWRNVVDAEQLDKFKATNSHELREIYTIS